MPFPSIPSRDQAGSLVLPRPTKEKTSAAAIATNEVLECGGNVQLMEARLCQITSSIRALIRSNVDLEEALEDTPSDPDFLQAVEENKIAIRRQGKTAMYLVDAMNGQGANINLEEDVEQALSTLDDVVVVSGSTRTEQNSRTDVTNNVNEPSSPSDDTRGSSNGISL